MQKYILKGDKQMSNLNKYKETTLEIIEKIGCEYEVFTSENTASEVEKAYFKAVEEGKKGGFVPVLVVSDDTLAEWLGILEDEKYAKEKVLSSKEDGKQFLQNRYKEYTDDFMEDNDYDEDEKVEALEELVGDLEEAEGEEIRHFMGYQSYTGNGIEEVILFRIPVKNPWEVVAWLPMGGWNECPPAEEMMAVAKYWYEQYGAVIATMSHDTLEFYVENQVEDGDKAMELANEMYSFCPDCVDQGVGCIAELWAGIRKSNVWFFWWD